MFKGSIHEIHASHDPSSTPGHPAHTMKRENRAVEQLISALRAAISDATDGNRGEGVIDDLKRLYAGLDIHYKKKENLLFPFMEQYGITAPPKVMWGVDDEIRKMLRGLQTAAEAGQVDVVRQKADEAFAKVTDMIFKEESILLPILLENLTQDEWKQAADGSAEFGYCLIDNISQWTPGESCPVKVAPPPSGPGVGDTEGIIRLPSGSFTVEELTHVLNVLPIDITFVGKDDAVRYFSQSNERIFPRTLSIIGRQVSNCHPPASVHIVEKLVDDFKSGVKENEDFWIKMGDKFVLIRYFAVRDTGGEYLGVLEVTQDIAPIREIRGEKRLLSD